MTAFEAYTLYLALTRHFTSASYDFVKYNGKVKANEKTFVTRRDKYSFHKLSKHRNPQGLIISNCIKDNCKWVGDLFNDKADDNFTEWEKVVQSITYIFTSEIELLDDKISSNFVMSETSAPLLSMYYRKKISLETLVILMDVFGLFRRWEGRVGNNILWSTTFQLTKKYKPFLNYDREKIKKILKDRFGVL